jgi:hypothetical protein
MHKLILLPSDVPATGKSTLARCLSRYLDLNEVPNRCLAVVEEALFADEIELAQLQPQRLKSWFETATVVILDMATGCSAPFARRFAAGDWAGQLADQGVSLTVVLPVTADPDSFEPVLEAVETYSDDADYVIAHVLSGSYESEDRDWDRSYAARVMDMFETAELYLPELGAGLETELRARRLSLAQALMVPSAAPLLAKWLQPVLAQVDGVRRTLFGEALSAGGNVATTQGKAARQARVAA